MVFYIYTVLLFAQESRTNATVAHLSQPVKEAPTSSHAGVINPESNIIKKTTFISLVLIEYDAIFISFL